MFFIKISLISGISDTKIGLKSGNLFTDFLQYTGNLRDAFQYNEIVVLRQKCRIKFSDYAGEPYSIGISANGEL